MIDVTAALLAGVWANRDWVALFIIGVLFFLWRAAEFDARTLGLLLDMRAADAEKARRDTFLRDVADPRRAGHVVHLPGRGPCRCGCGRLDVTL